jgi:hypothetical protein
LLSVSAFITLAVAMELLRHRSIEAGRIAPPEP